MGIDQTNKKLNIFEVVHKSQRRKNMNTKRNFLTAAATTAILALASVAPAQAASFGTSGISFDEDTTVDFQLSGSYGIYKTWLNVYEEKEDGSLVDLGSLFKEIKAYDSADIIDTGAIKGPVVGTCGVTILDCEASFTFEADKKYTLGLINYGRWQDTTKAGVTPRYNPVYSTSVLNILLGTDDSGQRAVFGSSGGDELVEFTDAPLFQEGDLFADDVFISFEDAGNGNDMDFQDFTLKAKLQKDVPEPTVLLGLGVAVGGMFLTRRNKSKAS